MREYALMPDTEITAERAAKFPVITNFPTQIVFESHIVEDARGQQSEIITDYTLCRWIESSEAGFSTEQNTIIETAKTNFNKGRGNKPKLPDAIKGNSEFARNFDSGKKIKNTEY